MDSDSGESESENESAASVVKKSVSSVAQSKPVAQNEPDGAKIAVEAAKKEAETAKVQMTMDSDSESESEEVSPVLTVKKPVSTVVRNKSVAQNKPDGAKIAAEAAKKEAETAKVQMTMDSDSDSESESEDKTPKKSITRLQNLLESYFFKLFEKYFEGRHFHR